MKTFEQYLKLNFEKENPQVLDDDLPDAFEHWYDGLDKNDLVNLAEEFAKELQV